MWIEPGKAALPANEPRWKLVEATLRRHGYQSHALIEGLHTVQNSFGYLDKVALRYLSSALGVPLSQVYGVATFYHFFTLKPQGKHTCVVCTGTACYLKGAPDILEGLTEAHGVAAGQTTADGEFSLVTARCLGSCGMAPAVVFDGEVGSRMTRKEVLKRVEGMLADAA